MKQELKKLKKKGKMGEEKEGTGIDDVNLQRSCRVGSKIGVYDEGQLAEIYVKDIKKSEEEEKVKPVKVEDVKGM